MRKDPRSETILVVSRDPRLADVRRELLQNAGYRVISATSFAEVTRVCRDEEPLDLVLIGYCLPAPEKRRVVLELWGRCRSVPVLELHKTEAPGLPKRARVYSRHSRTPGDFLPAVKAALKRAA